MSLTLQIENFHVLDDGGPVSVQVPPTGLQAGRRPGVDWVLPDASRYISGCHFEITHDGHKWWLRDVSTNGTFLQGHQHRLNGPHPLANGDRFQVGQYIIVALLNQPQTGPAMSAGSLPEHRVDQPVMEAPGDDPWAVGSPALSPIDVASHGSSGRRGSEFVDDFFELGNDGGRPAPPDPAASPFGAPPAAPPLAPDVARPPMAAPAPVASAPTPLAAPKLDESAFLRGFCRGAGLDLATDADLDPEAFGRALGEAMRSTVTQVMMALRDRSAARHFTRGGERTMRGAADNNPMKFLPDPEQALDALFLRPRAGFLTGASGFDEALGDLRRHQAALFAALQPALIELLHDLDPSRIETEAKSGPLGGSKKARAWDEYVSRWDAKTASENGILDEFIRLFAAAYRKADETGGFN